MSYTKDDIIYALKPYLLALSKCIQKAWDEYINERNPHRKSKRSKATIINDEMIENAIEEFKSIKETYFGKHRGLRLMVIKTAIGNMLIRFNKLDKYSKLKVTRNNTQQEVLFDIQDSLFPMTEINLTIGYTVDEKGMNFQIYIIRTDDNRGLMWDYCLTNYGSAGITNLPVIVTPPPTTKQKIYKRTSNKNNTKKPKQKEK